MNAPAGEAQQRGRHTQFGFKAFQLCRGQGIEIGPLSKPFDLDAQVEYADLMTADEMRVALAGGEGDHDLDRLAPITHILKPPFFNLPEVPSASRDFVISSHALEHHPNPIHALSEYLRVVRPGGYVYIVIPNMRETFDRRRQVTPPQYLWRRYQDFAFDYPEQRALEVANMSRHFGPDIKRGSPAAVAAVTTGRPGEQHLFTYTGESVLELLHLARDALRARLTYFNITGVNIHFALQRTVIAGV